MNRKTVLRTLDGKYQVDSRDVDGAEVYALVDSSDNMTIATPRGVAIEDGSFPLMERIISDLNAYRLDYTEPALILTYVYTYVDSRKMGSSDTFADTVDSMFKEFLSDDWAVDIAYLEGESCEEKEKEWYRIPSNLWESVAMMCFLNAMRSPSLLCRLIELDRTARNKEGELRNLAILASRKSGVGDTEWFFRCFMTFLFAYNMTPEEKTETPDEETDHDAEFNEDIRKLMAREDIQCATDICEAEYKKAEDLADEDDSDSVLRAYDIMGNLATQFNYVPAILWMGDFAEGALENPGQAAFWYKKAADLGDGNGARNYADMLMTGQGLPKDREEAKKYYSMAAENGVPEAAFVMGEFLRNSGDREGALKAYQKAADAGYAPASFRIEQMKKGER